MFTSILSIFIANTLAIPPALSVEPAQASHEINREFQASTLNSILLKKANTPQKDPAKIAPILDANGLLVMDLETESVLYEKNKHTRMPIASITKLMTVLIAIEENDLQEEVTITNEAASVEGSTMYLRTGEKITLENLIYGALINSGNDAATAIAIHNAGSTEEFVKKMNKKALSMGLINTHFTNATGLDDFNSYSSPYDVARLAKAIYKYDFIKEAVNIQEKEVYSTDLQFKHKLENTNKLLSNEFIKFHGLKTGRTDAAGQCLVSIAENKNGNKIINVVLNSPDRFTESKFLSDWTFRAYNWK